MPRPGVRLFSYVLAMVASAGATSACGSRTGVGLIDGMAADASPDGASYDGAELRFADALVDHTVADASLEASSGPPRREAGTTDGAVDAAGDVEVVDAPSESESESEAGPDAGPDAGDEELQPPSCRTSGDGRTNCGATESESCCTSLQVEGGTYFRTYDPIMIVNGVIEPVEGGATDEADPATVSGFRLDKYPVTVGRFRSFVAAWDGGAGYFPPAQSGKHTHLNGGQGLANAASPGSFEPGWITSDDGNVAPTTANLTCATEFYPIVTWAASPGATRRGLSTA